jgi:UDP-N-acetyl-2-amino-2-deoxyglucuronate dehydrogenase
MNKGSKIKFAVAGYGHIGKRHASMIINNRECELAAICDASPKVLEVSHLNIPFFRSIDELLTSGIQFDVLCIATPNGLHEEHALKALRAGCHVVIEKPMALTTGGCERIIAEAAKQDRHVFCVMQNRYSPPAVWMKEVVENKILGDIYIVQVSCYWNRDERYYTGDGWHGTKLLDGGTLFTQFSHFIDTIYWLFGEIDNVEARLYNFNHADSIEFEDSGFINFDLIRGGKGSLNYSTAVWNQNLESSITIIGQHGSVKVGGQYMEQVQFCSIKDYDMPQIGQQATHANHSFVIRDVVDVLKGKAPVTTNAADGMKVVAMIEQIYNSVGR